MISRSGASLRKNVIQRAKRVAGPQQRHHRTGDKRARRVRVGLRERFHAFVTRKHFVFPHFGHDGCACRDVHPCWALARWVRRVPLAGMHFIASMLGIAATRVRVVGKLIATAAKRTPRQDGARRTDWRFSSRILVRGSPRAVGRSLTSTCHRRMPPPLRRLITVRWPYVLRPLTNLQTGSCCLAAVLRAGRPRAWRRWRW